jgi:hypothetical protein
MADLTTAATEIAGQATDDPLVDDFGAVLTDEDVDTTPLPPPAGLTPAPIWLIMRMFLHK